MQVLIYARVSHDDTGRARSVDEQIADCQEWAFREGWDVAHVVRELGSASRYAKRKRPEWALVLELIDSGTIDAVLTWEASRAQRDLTAYSELRDKCVVAGVKWGYSGRLYDFADRDSRFRTGLDALLAEDEAARTSERVKRAVRANAMAGKVHGKDLYGYRRVYDPSTRRLVRIEEHPDQAPVVREIFSRTLAGEGTYTIAADLNRRNIPPRRPATKPGRANAGWTTIAVSEIAFKRAAYAGIRQYRGEFLDVEVDWPQIVDRAQWDELQLRKSRMPRRNPAEWKIKHLLTGIAVCGICGQGVRKEHANYVTGNERRQRDIYRCSRVRVGEKSHVVVSLRMLDELVVDVLLRRMSSPDALARYSNKGLTVDSEVQDLAALIEKDQTWLDDVMRAAAETNDLTMLIEQRKIILPRIEANQRKLRSVTTADAIVVDFVSSGDVASTWESMSIERRRRLISAVLTPVVRPAASRGFRGRVQERVEIAWH